MKSITLTRTCRATIIGPDYHKEMDYSYQVAYYDSILESNESYVVFQYGNTIYIIETNAIDKDSLKV